jgi:hypothetical protein
MKNKNLVVKLLLSSIFFVLLTLIELLFKYFKVLDDQSTFDIIIRALLSAILYFSILFFWLKRKMKKAEQIELLVK